jgi:predicted RNase H-like HicB family nuclease
MQYTVLVFEAEPDEGGFWAKVVQLPGCYTSGETLDEVRTNAKEAIEAWLDAFGSPDDEPPRVAATLAVEVGA